MESTHEVTPLEPATAERFHARGFDRGAAQAGNDAGDDRTGGPVAVDERAGVGDVAGDRLELLAYLDA